MIYKHYLLYCIIETSERSHEGIHVQHRKQSLLATLFGSSAVIVGDQNTNGIFVSRNKKLNILWISLFRFNDCFDDFFLNFRQSRRPSKSKQRWHWFSSRFHVYPVYSTKCRDKIIQLSEKSEKTVSSYHYATEWGTKTPYCLFFINNYIL